MSTAPDQSVSQIWQTATLSRVGLGAWAFGGVGWGPQDDHDSIAAIHRAVELGVNWIDTAAIYGGGHAELVVGQAISELPQAERPLIFTKAGLGINPSTGKTYRDLSPASLRVECEASLKRLKVERLDLYQIHWPVDDTEVVEQAWHTFAELRREGKVRWIGVSNFDIELIRLCAGIHPLDSVQIPLSLVSRQAAEKVLPWSLSNSVAALAYSPLESGLLSGKFSMDRIAALHPGDWRAGRAQFQSPELERTLELVGMLRPIADELDASLVQLAIAWVLSSPGVTGAIVGARSQNQVDGWIAAGDLSLESDTLKCIASVLEASEAGAGPCRLGGT